MHQRPNQANISISKDLYFLPVIRELELKHLNRKKTARHASVHKFRSIEQIMFTKSIIIPRQQNSFQQTKNQNLPKIENLYDKYYCLPKLFSKFRKQNQDSKFKQDDSQIANDVQIKILEMRNTLKEQGDKKQNSFDFSSSLYRERFNQKIEKEISKIGFSIKYAKQNNMLIAENIVVADQETENRQTFKHKYTRLQLPEKNTPQRQAQLQKVPSFLLKLLESKQK